MKLSDIVGTMLSIRTDYHTRIGTTVPWTAELVRKHIKTTSYHRFFDVEFFHNWTDHQSEYLATFTRDTLLPMLNKIDDTLEKYFILKDGIIQSNEKYDQSVIDQWFKDNKTISNNIKRDYVNYRKEYFGEVVEIK